MKLKNYRTHLTSLSFEDLRAELHTTEQELFNVRLNVRAGQLKNYASIAKIKRNIARIKTVLGNSEPVNDMLG